MIQETYDRVKDIVPAENIFISAVKNIYQTTKEQLPEISDKNFIIEPEGKNTAPAIGLIATLIHAQNPQAIVATIASDHTVNDNNVFKKVIGEAFSFVENKPDYLVTVGIKPTEPNTGYGYIKLGRKFSDESAHEVDKFVEKPNLETAQGYVDSGEYLWNASYFVWQAESMINNFQQFAPHIHAPLVRVGATLNTAEFEETLEKEYAGFLKEPVEPAIIEKMEKVAVIPADMGWSDVGTWSSLYEILSKNTGEANISRGHHIGLDDKNCLIYAQDKLLATVGLEDIVIVDTPDVTLVCNKSKSQEIKTLMEKLKNAGYERYL